MHPPTPPRLSPPPTALQVNTCDDHDIFDGWGSYPAALQDCAVFRGVFEAARAAYLLFQVGRLGVKVEPIP